MRWSILTAQTHIRRAGPCRNTIAFYVHYTIVMNLNRVYHRVGRLPVNVDEKRLLAAISNFFLQTHIQEER